MMTGLDGWDLDAAYSVDGYRGIAWRIDGPDTEPDADTEWTGCEVATGRVRMHMVGDDREFAFDPSDVHVIPEDDYCTECGQIGCTADGRDRTAWDDVGSDSNMGGTEE
jgi:hypothetical protein